MPLALYALLAVADVVFRAAAPEWEPVVKPLLMPALAWWFWRACSVHATSATPHPPGGLAGASVEAKADAVPRKRLMASVLAALFFSWLGDVFLLGNTETRFLLGLTAFLLAHLAYLAAFSTGPQRPAEQPGSGRSGLAGIPWAILPVLAFAGVLVGRLWPALGDMRGPVVAYATVIAAMALGALHRYGKVSTASFAWTAAGACTFVVSDATIAWNKFGEPFAAAGPLIMATYTAAQGMLAYGLYLQLATAFSPRTSNGR